MDSADENAQKIRRVGEGTSPMQVQDKVVLSDEEEEEEDDKELFPGSPGADPNQPKIAGLSPELQMVIAAINGGPLKQDISAVRQSMTKMGKKVGALETKVETVQSTLSEHDKAIKALQIEVQRGRAASSAPSSDAGSSVSTHLPRSPPRAYPSRSSSMREVPPKHLRRTLILGGWPYDTESHLILTDLHTLFDPVGNTTDLKPMGKFTSLAAVEFVNPAAMWSFIKSNKGTRLKIPNGPHQNTEIWFQVERNEEERRIRKCTMQGADFVKKIATEKSLIAEGADVEQCVLSDPNRGIVFFRRSANEAKHRVVESNPYNTDEFKLSSDFAISGLPGDGSDILAAANAR